MEVIQQYRAWLYEHDETEDSVSYKEWLAMSYPDDVPFQNLTVVSEAVGGNLTKKRSSQVMDEVARDADSDLKLGLVALARSRMSRIAATMGFVDRIERKLESKIDVDNASIDQLISAGRLLRNSLRSDLKLVTEVVRSSQSQSPVAPQTFNLSIGDRILNMGDEAAKHALASRDSRDRARTVLDVLLETASKDKPVKDI